MKLQVERDPLAEAVAWTARALPARPTAPVLAGMRLQAGSELTLSTFDYEVSAQATIPVPGRRAGHRAGLRAAARRDRPSLPAKPVDLATDGTRTTLNCGSATFTLMLLPAEEYPTLPDMPDTTGTVGADAFASAINQVAIAAGRDDTLPALTGIRMEIDEDTLTLVATDRYRLAVRELRWTPAAPGLTTAVLVPARVLGDTARQMTGGAEVSIALATDARARSDGIIGFEGGGRRTTTRLLSGEYPRYQTLLPSEFSAVAELPARAVRGRGQARRPGRRAEHPGPADLRPGRGAARGGHRRRGAGERGDRRELRRRAAADRLQPAVPARRASTRSTPTRSAISFTTGAPARRDHRQGRGASPTTATSSCPSASADG